MDDEVLLQRLGVTAARAEDVERHVIAAHIESGENAADETISDRREAIAKQLSVLHQEIEAVQDGLQRLGEDGEIEQENLHSTLAKDRLQSLKSKRKRLRAQLRALGDEEQPASTSVREEGDGDALVETERERLVRLGELTPFDNVKGFERRVRTQSEIEREKLANASVSNAVASLAAISRSRPSTKLLDPSELPKLEGPTREFKRIRRGSGRPSKKRKRPLPDPKWRQKMSEYSSDENEDIDREEVAADEDSDDVVLEGGLKIPVEIYNKLFDYQKTGVKWLWELHALKTGGIIGDEMGLGKTIQIVSFLAALHHSRMYRPSIVVCPVTLVQQWKSEVEKWYPKLEVQIVHDSGAPQPRKKIKKVKHSDDSDDTEDETEDDSDADKKHRRKKKKKQEQWDDIIDKTVQSASGLIVTTYEQLRLHRDKLLDVRWGYAILDEGHKIRNPDAEVTLISKQLQTVHRIIMTGAPIQNKLTELWSLFDFVFPGKLGVLPIFQAQFALPIQIGGYANATPLQVSTGYKCAVVLRDLIMPYLLRRMKSDVQANLTKKTEHVLFCSLSVTQRAAYRDFLASSEVEGILEGSRNALAGIDILRKICNHPDLLERESSDNHPDYGSAERSGKLMVLSQVLESWKDQGHRVLIFCQTQQMLDIVESFVVSREYTYRRMDGQTPIKQRAALINEFNNSSHVFVFLLTTKVGGLGTNLTGANRVIIYDPDWNPSTDIQARERAWRIGQTKDVTVYRLITRGTIEEKVYHRQIYKQFLTDKILRDPQQRRIFKSRDLKDLFVLNEETNEHRTETSSLFAELTNEMVTEPEKSRNGKEIVEFEGDTNEADDGAEDSRLLKSLIQATGIHSTMDHDAILGVNDQERVKVELEATRVAERAADAIQQSRLSRMRSGVAVPTWTGTSGAAGLPGGGPRRFGAATNSRLLPSTSEGNTGSSSRVLSSGELLAEMRTRQAAAANAGREAGRGLVDEMSRFLRENGGSALSSSIVDHFKAKVPQSELRLFKQLLNEIATLKKEPGGHSRWFLKTTTCT